MAADRRAADLGEDVAAEQVLLALDDDREVAAAHAGAIGGRAVVDDLDEVSRRHRHAHDAAELVVHGPSLHAEPRPHDAAHLAQVAQDRLGGVDRHREADRLRVLRDQRVDADHDAAAIHERSAGVSRVDRRVGLDHGLVGDTGQQPVEPAHDPARHRLVEADRVADGDDLVADPDGRRVAEPCRRQRRPAVHAQQRDVEHGIHSQNARGRFVARVERDRQRRRAVDHVGVREDLAVLVDDHAGADDGLEAPLRLGLVDLHRLDGDDGGGDALEHRGERIDARLRGGHGRKHERGEYRDTEPHRTRIIH